MEQIGRTEQDIYTLQDQLVLVNVLKQLAKGHTGNGKPLRLKTDKQIAQTNLGSYKTEGHPLNLTEADEVAKMALNGYLEARQTMLENPEVIKVINEVIDILSRGGNIILTTAHDNIIDIVVGLLMLRDLIAITCTKDKKQYQDIVKSLDILVSKIVKILQYQSGELIIPADDVIGLFCNTIYTSFPQTVSTEGKLVGLPHNMVSENNGLLRAEIANKFDNGGTVLGVALTGTTKRVTDDNTGDSKLAELSNGTKIMITHPKAWVLPVAVTVGKTINCNGLGKPRRLTNEQDITKFMDYLGKFGLNPTTLKSMGNIASS